MPNYVVYWAIDAEDARDPDAAARGAMADFMRTGSIAHVFHVVPAEVAPDAWPAGTVEVDLDEIRPGETDRRDIPEIPAEPWHYGEMDAEREAYPLRDRNGFIVGWAETAEHAERIIACVNACQGMEKPRRIVAQAVAALAREDLRKLGE